MMSERDIASEVAVRARVHAALGDAHRLVIVEALMLGDASPAELAVAMGIGTNLTAHHLEVLEEAGLVRRRPSQGDRRRKYVQLVPEALQGLLHPPQLQARSLLFVCTHNSARSQLAAGLWNRHSPIRAISAGTAPAAAVHPLAVAVAAAHGLDLSGARPCSYQELHDPPDLVVSVCDLARESHLPFEAPKLHWSIPDPVAAGREAFEDVYRELEVRVDRLVPRVLRAV